MKKAVALALAGLLLAAPPAALAGRDEEGSPDAIRVELERLRILYTDDHPDVQILKRRLDKGLQQKKRLAEEKAQRQREKEERRLLGPPGASAPNPQPAPAPPPQAAPPQEPANPGASR
ncbi:MAG: hypothetical protein HY910_11445 [Desulfarculus sp.]|nr:hypothetical protein [Desulfarculus sp.]